MSDRSHDVEAWRDGFTAYGRTIHFRDANEYRAWLAEMARRAALDAADPDDDDDDELAVLEAEWAATEARNAPLVAEHVAAERREVQIRQYGRQEPEPIGLRVFGYVAVAVIVVGGWFYYSHAQDDGRPWCSPRHPLESCP